MARWSEKRIQKHPPERLTIMHRMYGQKVDSLCGDCRHFYAPGGTAGVYYKCDLTKVTGGPGSDWRGGWMACGRFESRGKELEEE